MREGVEERLARIERKVDTLLARQYVFHATDCGSSIVDNDLHEAEVFLDRDPAPEDVPLVPE